MMQCRTVVSSPDSQWAPLIATGPTRPPPLLPLNDAGPLPWQLAALSLALLTVVAVQAEPLLSARLWPRYHTRPADSTGLCAGLLAAPWALAGLAVRQQRQQQRAEPANSGMLSIELWLPAAMAASALAAGVQAAQHLLRQLRELRRSAAAAASAPTFPEVAEAEAARWREAVGKACRLGALLAAAGGAFAAACLCSRTHALGLAAAALAPTALRLFHTCMHALPRTFTPGEGLLLTQVAVLLAARSVEDQWRLRWRHEPEAYVPGLISHLLLLSTSCGAALISLFQLAQQQQKEQERRSRGCRPPVAQPGGGPPRSLILASAGVLAAMAAAVASPVAYWLLRHALQQRQRLVLLAYWAAVLGTSLPAMAWLAASGRLPNIVGELGRGGCWPSLIQCSHLLATFVLLVM